jgi:hypothetical protein
LVDLLGDFISDYWKNCKQINDSQPREDQYEKEGVIVSVSTTGVESGGNGIGTP